MKLIQKPKARTSNILEQDLLDEIIIYDSNTDKAFCFNKTLYLVWKSADGTKTITELANILSEKLNTPPNEDLVWLAIDELRKGNLMAADDVTLPRFSPTSRREAIRKIGITTALAIPILTSIVAPDPARAASPGACVPYSSLCVFGVSQCCPDPEQPGITCRLLEPGTGYNDLSTGLSGVAQPGDAACNNF